jgi:hypothetical protein
VQFNILDYSSCGRIRLPWIGLDASIIVLGAAVAMSAALGLLLQGVEPPPGS